MSLFGKVIVPRTMSVHDVSPSGMRKRITCGMLGDATRDFTLGQAIAAAVVPERLAACLGGFAALVELRGRAEARVGFAGVHETLDVCPVPLEVRALVDDVFVPEQAQPLHALEDRARAFVGAARLVGVLDAQEELAAVVLDVQPIEQGRPRTTNMEVPGRA